MRAIFKILMVAAFAVMIKPVSTHAQFILFDDAVSLGTNSYRITDDVNNQAGSVWYKLAQDLKQPFTVSGQFNFGAREDGADGIVFVMQNNCVNGGTFGGGIGYSNMPGLSLGIEFDTYQNIAGTGNQDNADSTFDHIAIQKHGNVKHYGDSTLTQQVQMHPTKVDVEDSLNYNFQITWDPITETIEVHFNDSLRILANIDLVDSIFGGDDVIYWGFTSATGGFTAPNSVIVDPIAGFGLSDPYICVGDTAQIFLPPLNNKENVSQGKPSWSLSDENIAFPSSQANDGNMATRWSSAFFDPNWITIDLADTYDVDSIKLKWQVAAGLEYYILTGTDTVNWDTVVHVTNGVNDELRLFQFARRATRYVRVLGIQRTTVWGYSIEELEVFGQGRYEWTPTTYIDDTTSQSPKLYPPVTTVYTVKVPDKCNGATFVNYTVNVDTIDVDLGSDLDFCDGDSVLLQPIIIGNYGDVNYVWNQGLSTDSAHFVSPIASSEYIIQVTDTIGCSNSDSILVTNNPLPTADAGIDDSICVGGLTNLNAVGGGTYLWTPSTGLVDSSVANTSAAPIITTQYTLQVTDFNGCSDHDSVIIVVHDLPVADAGMDTSVCVGDSVTLGGSGAGVVGTYTWNQGLGAGQIHELVVLTSQTYTLSVTDSNLCVDSDSISVNAIPNVIPSVSFITSSNSTCIGASYQFTVDDSSNGGSNPSFQWMLNGVNVGVGMNSFSSSSLVDNDIMSVIMNSSVQCSDPDTAYYLDTVSINPVSTTPQVSISPSKTSLCGTDSVIITVNDSMGGGADPVFEWYINGMYVGNDNNALFLDSLTISSNIQVVMNSNDVCPTKPSDTADVSLIVTTVVPSITITGPSGSMCVNDTYQASVSSVSNQGTIPSVQWYLNGIPASGDLTGFSINNIVEGDLVHLELVSSENCAITPVTSNTLIANVVPCECDLFIPNAISPNGDGNNDSWQVSGLECYVSHVVRVYNRYGSMVYNSVDYLKPWEGIRNGEPMPIGTYYYVITTVDSNKESQDYTGTLTIIR